MEEDIKAFKSIIENCSNSKYLSRFGIDKHSTLQEFKNKVPLVTYQELEYFIDRAYNGEKNIFSREPIIFWGMTSGTTGKPKLIPHTKSSLRVYRKKTNPFLIKLLFNNLSIIKGKVLILTGHYCNWKSPKGIVVGSISGMIASKIPKLFSNRVLYNPKELDNIPDKERFSYLAKKVSKENITMIASSSATYLLGFFEELEKVNNKIVRNIFPNLKVISCPGGGDYKNQIDEISKIIPNVKIIDTGLSATEGCFFISNGGRETVGLPNNKDYLIELLDIKTKNALNIDKAELNKKYELVISAINGILRYRMGDFVQVIIKNGKRMLKFIDKRVSEISLFGERITKTQLIDAFLIVMNKHNIKRDNFMFISPFNNKKFNRYYLIMSSKKRIKVDNIQEEIEEKLKEMNINYKNIRIMTNLLNSLKVILVSESDFSKIKEEVYKNNFSGQGRKKEVYIPEKEDFYKFLLSKELK
jgi:hypothetical protein